MRKYHFFDLMKDVKNDDLNQQINYLIEAAEESDPSAIINLANFYYYGYLNYAPQFELAFKWYYKASLMQVPYGHFGVALCYLEGHGVEQDYLKAYDYLERADQGGITAAKVNLGYIYENGYLGKVDGAMAFYYYQQAALYDDPQGCYNLANCYLHGMFTNQNEVEARFYFKKAVDLGHVAAMVTLGYMYKNGIGGEVNDDLALNVMKEAANYDNPIALYNLGIHFLFSSIKAEEIKEGIDYLEASMKQGYDPAILKIAELYLEGSVYDQDIDKGIQLLEELANRDYEEAILVLAHLYRDGDIVEKNDDAYFHWLSKVVQLNSFEAMIEMGDYYYHQEDYQQQKQALAFYRMAYEQAYLMSYVKIGNCYYNGIGTVQDMNKAIEYFNQGANQGDPYCHSILGHIYFQGEGIIKVNFDLAYQHTLIAAEAGLIYAGRRLAMLYQYGQGTKKDLSEAIYWLNKGIFDSDDLTVMIESFDDLEYLLDEKAYIDLCQKGLKELTAFPEMIERIKLKFSEHVFNHQELHQNHLNESAIYLEELYQKDKERFYLDLLKTIDVSDLNVAWPESCLEILSLYDNISAINRLKMKNTENRNSKIN